jgi:hypothetical protein
MLAHRDPMIPALLGLYALRDRLEQAIVALEPVMPALEAWEAARQGASAEGEQAADRPPLPPGDPGALSGAPEPSAGHSEAATPATNGVGAPHPVCAHCRSPFNPGRSAGAPRRYCTSACRTAAAADRARTRELEAAEPEPLPDLAEAERPFGARAPDDARSDPAALRPPALPGLENGTG